MPFILDEAPTEQIVMGDEPSLALDRCPAKAKVAQFEKLYPIMARLPGSESSVEGNASSEQYLHVTPQSSIPGTLPYHSSYENVRYTHSRLPEIDQESKDLWVALHNLHPLTSSYAGNFQCRSRMHLQSVSQDSCPMGKSSTSLDLVRRVFNWNDLTLPESTDAIFYGVVFRSKRSAGSDTEALMRADKLSHEEAVASGRLLMYWYGIPDPQTGSNLATCIWRTREEARKVSGLPFHRRAARLAAKSYADYELSRYKVVKKKGEVGVSVEEWD